jgi:hypothetical protein
MKNIELSPKYIMDLIWRIEQALWELFPSSKYKNVKNYIFKWQKIIWSDWWWDEYNFDIVWLETWEINLSDTLHRIKDHELLLRIAIDLWIETPWFLPVVSSLKNTLKENYQNAFDNFDKAIKQLQDDPDIAIALANSTLESIIKHICDDPALNIAYNRKDTLYSLTQTILSAFELLPSADMPKEIKKIGSSLISISDSIENIRSNKTLVHGKWVGDIIVKERIYGYFIVNAISTVGLFLINFYHEKWQKQKFIVNDESQENDIAIEDVPF